MEKLRCGTDFSVLISNLNKMIQVEKISPPDDFKNDECQNILVINQNIKISSSLSLEEFLVHYYSPKLPVRIFDYMANAPCCDARKWSLTKFLNSFGNRSFPVEIGRDYTKTNWRQEIMTFDEFYTNYISKNSNQKSEIAYIAQFNIFQLIPELILDYPLPEYAQVSENKIEVNVYIGPAHTVTPFHFDKSDNILCQIYGCKKVYLIPPDDTLELVEGFTNNTSLSKAEMLEKFSGQYIETNLFPGEVLYIPKKWWHYCESLTESISVSNWF